MKKDNPLRMINAGRYKTCFADLSPEMQADVLVRMERLIEENRQWYDRGNYGHLCNILPTLAIDEALQAVGKTPEESLEILSKYMWGALKPEGMQRLAEKRFFMPHTDFIRTQTLCQGGDLCDFRFVRHAKNESWQRTESI